jgi:ketosteroid isomerase-like protein
MGVIMTETAQTDIIRNGWATLAAGELDKLASDYAEDMIVVLPGQDDVLEARAAFRSALDNVPQALPGGFDIKSISYCTGENEGVPVLRFTADKLPNGSQCAVLFRFNSDDKITEERWFVDTEQWKAAF